MICQKWLLTRLTRFRGKPFPGNIKSFSHDVVITRYVKTKNSVVLDYHVTVTPLQGGDRWLPLTVFFISLVNWDLIGTWNLDSDLWLLPILQVIISGSLIMGSLVTSVWLDSR